MNEPVKCGVYHRHKQRPAKGPRGGRALAITSECVACGRKSSPVIVPVTDGARKLDAMDHGTRELSRFDCPTPEKECHHGSMLSDLSTLIESGTSPPLWFVVKHKVVAHLEDAVMDAWDASVDGCAMGEFVRAVSGKGHASRGTDGTVLVRCELIDLDATFHGSREKIAQAVRFVANRDSMRSALEQRLAAIRGKKWA
jgi:hypothetical protein